jgi:hypothetical protein
MAVVDDQRNDDHRRAALAHAQLAKTETARLKRQIRAAGREQGARIAAEAILNPRSSVRFLQLLLAIPRVGEVRARRMLGIAGISPVARVNSDLVDPRRRGLLAHLLVGPPFDADNGRAA